MRNLMLLVRKDFLSVLMTPSSLVTTLFLFVFLIGVNPALVFVLVIYMMVINLFAYDENELVCNVTAILPVRMREVVIARYLYAWLILLVTTIVGGGMSGLLNTFFLKSGSDWVSGVLIALAAALLMLSVIMPLNYKLGVTRARIASMVIYILMVMLSTVASTMLSMEVPEAMEAARSLPLAAIGGISVLACLLLSVLSMFISMGIKKN